MTQFKLKPFSKNTAIDSITGHVKSTSIQNTLSISLSFIVIGDIENLKIPVALGQARRENELWQSTCFELFLSQDDLQEYQEFNFSPSGNWQSYNFTQYRTGMTECQFLSLTKSQVSYDPKKLCINLELEYVSRDIVTKSFKIGISCILQDLADGYHYYSLGHASKADFHDKKFHLIPLATEE